MFTLAPTNPSRDMPLTRIAAVSAILLPLTHLPTNAVGQTTPNFMRDVTVHDPSVIKVGDRFYVYGSHGASAWTEDLMNWTQVGMSVVSGSPTHFRTFQSELSELIAWTGSNTLWAPDVYQLPDGKFYYYYNVWTDFQGYRSYLGVARSDSIEGPYEDLGEILIGGVGVAGFNADVDPNTVDPTLFRDAQNKLWMVYGSYSGGIFLLEMDDETGFPLEGQGWGTYLLGGNHSKIEGAFIEYHEETGFYYQFLSFGGLGANDGYNMRVFRSASPEGPYLDPAGNDISTAAVSSDNATIAPYGLKLAGNWQFTPVEGESAGTPTGYRSPGHNSVIQDPDTGKWFNFFHTRFEGRGEIHEVRVHQLFFNEDGWPVMAPHRYAGEMQGSHDVATVSGTYKTIDHGKDITGALKTSSRLGLRFDGGLVGADGEWTLSSDGHLQIEADGVLYKGVVSDFWDNENSEWVMGFTVASSDGVSLWGSQVVLPGRSDSLQAPSYAETLDMALPFGDALALQLSNQNSESGLDLNYSVLEGPDGLSFADGNVDWTPQASQSGKSHTVRLLVNDRIETHLAAEISFTVYAGASPQDSRIQKWKTEQFGQNPAAGMAGHDDDPDADGNTNLVEYALGSDPLQADSGVGSQVSIQKDKLVWIFQYIDDPALQFEIRASDSLIAGDEETIWRSSAAENANEETRVEVPLPAPGETPLFLRLYIDSVE